MRDDHLVSATCSQTRPRPRGRGRVRRRSRRERGSASALRPECRRGWSRLALEPADELVGSRCAADRSRRPPSDTSARRRGRRESPRPEIASASAITRALTAGSIRSSNSTTRAESPAGTMRYGVDMRRSRAAQSERSAPPSARSSFWWMPPKPPFDIMTTRSPGRCSRTMASTMSSIESASRADWPRPCEIAHQLRHRQPLGLRQRRPKHRRDQHLVGRGERPREIVLKHAAARRGRARLEHRPDARRRIATRAGRRAFRPPPSDGARNRRRRSRRPTVPTTSSRRLTPANVSSPSAIRSALMPTSVATAIAAEGVAHVVRADQRHLELAERRTAVAGHGSASLRRPVRDRAPASRRLRPVRTSRPARPPPPRAPARPGCRRR